jgi:hypothetical protein
VYLKNFWLISCSCFCRYLLIDGVYGILVELFTGVLFGLTVYVVLMIGAIGAYILICSGAFFTIFYLSY